MKKIKSVFMRNYDSDRLVYDSVVPGCEWVIQGEGIATRKYDGTCCLITGDKNLKYLFKRYDAKNGKTPPANFIPAQDPDPITGHWPGWVPVTVWPSDTVKPENKWFVIAFLRQLPSLKAGTYELCGPHIQANPEKIYPDDIFIRHGADVLTGVPRTFDGIRDFLKENYIEGIVFHRENGEMAKIKRVDFGFEWNGKTFKQK